MAPSQHDVLPKLSNWGTWGVGTNAKDWVYFSGDSAAGTYRFVMCTSGTTTKVNNNDHSIVYTISTGIWSDGGTKRPDYVTTTTTSNSANPASATAHPTELYLWGTVSTTEMVGFDLSTVSWSQSTTGTSGGSTPSGSITESNGIMSLIIDSQSPSTDGNITYLVLKDGVGHGGVSHTSGSTTTFTTSIHLGSSNEWKIRLDSTTGLYTTQDLATYNHIHYSTSGGKVFCNFW